LKIPRLSRLRAVRGILRLIQNMPDSAVILQRDFLEAVSLLPKYNLSFDICIDPHQSEHTIEMVSRCPSVSFVPDQMGKPEDRENWLGSWHESMSELSSLPNVTCKLSGSLTQADHATWSEDQVPPLIDHTIDRFGVDRAFRRRLACAGTRGKLRAMGRYRRPRHAAPVAR
jgi:L-fuconolactonase